MSRYIDTLPTPEVVKPKKLIVLSAPRTGTHGLYEALKILGFKPYHMVEALGGGDHSLRILNQAIQAETTGKYKKYGDKEFDKWFADYDVILEMPFFTLEETLKKYPDAKFLLTERDPEKWAKSWMNTICVASLQNQNFPMSFYAHFDPFSYELKLFGKLMRDFYFKSDEVGDDMKQNLMSCYKDYIAKVKRLVPADRMKVIRLEDGFGWNEICPFMDVPIPDQKWPGHNTPEEFFQITQAFYTQGQKVTINKLSAIAAPLFAVGFWALRQGRIGRD